MNRTALLVGVAIALASERADAYEFWLRAQTIGQAYQLREYKLVGPDLFLGRRRYVETLALRIWDIGGFSAQRRTQRLPDRGVKRSARASLRRPPSWRRPGSSNPASASPCGTACAA